MPHAVQNRAPSFRSARRMVAASLGIAAPLLGVLAVSAAPARPERTGAQIWAQRCASCHGANGEGGRQYPRPLVGDRSVGELAPFIAKSMPPGAAKKPSADEAQRVAQHLYDAFYSPLAQARNRPPRIELSHLTVRQYRSALADLVGSFRPAARPDERRGLRGEYFKSRRMAPNERVLDRVDPEVRFDFGQAAPAAEQFDPHQFSIRWQGAVLAPETGEYEIVVRTDHATRLWLNDARKPLIDAWVKSGSDNEYRATVFMLGGRAYPVRLEFSKSKQGVDDSDKQKEKPPARAFVALEWKRPHRAAEPIPQRCLTPATVPEVFVAAAPFPPDDRSMGYERGTSVSKEWNEATTEGALEAAGYITARLRELAGVPEDAADRPARLREFCKQFLARAFRRPLTPELEQAFVERQFQAAPDPESAVRRVVLLGLKSPRFLYREVNAGEGDAYDTAAKLSFALWDSIPDADLLKAAAAGELSNREQVARQAERMLADPRARTKVRDFFLQWLRVDQAPDLAKDPKRYPGFDPAVAGDLRTSLELTLDAAVWSDASDYRQLLTGSQVFLNGRLARLYGADLPEEAPFQPVTLDAAERAGILTHPYLLASFAYLDSSSPIHRGVLLARNVLGRVLMPPQQAFTPLAVDAHPNLTTRQRVELQTGSAACQSCHSMINPLGYTLEKFDAVGRLRTTENGKPVDATGAYQPRAGKAVRFSGAPELARYVASSPEAHAAFVEKLFQYLVNQPVRAYGTQALPELERAFAAGQYSIRRQVVESAVTAALSRPAAQARRQL